MESDLELFERWQQGAQEAGSALFHRYYDSLCRFFANKVGDEIDDLVQRTFQACVSSKDQFGKRSSFRTYMYAIARNELYRYLRERRRKQGPLDFAVSSIEDLGITPRTLIDRNQRYQALLRALRSLPLEQQVLLELRYWEDLGPKELAEILDISITAINNRLLRAKKTLGTRLRQELESAALSSGDQMDLDSWARAVRTEWLGGDQSPASGQEQRAGNDAKRVSPSR